MQRQLQRKKHNSKHNINSLNDTDNDKSDSLNQLKDIVRYKKLHVMQ